MKFFTEEEQEAVIKVFTDDYSKDLDEFLEDTEGENILQIVLRGHLYIERELTSFLELALKNPDSLIKGRTFYGQKLNIAHAIGILSKDDKLSYEKIGEVRNSYAHKWGFQLQQSYLDDLVNSFKGPLKEFYDRYTKDNKEDNDDLVSNLRTAIGLMWSHLRLLAADYKDQKQVRDWSILAFKATYNLGLTDSEQETFDELMDLYGDKIIDGVNEKRRLRDEETKENKE